jgi:hypothetical protein
MKAVPLPPCRHQRGEVMYDARNLFINPNRKMNALRDLNLVLILTESLVAYYPSLDYLYQMSNSNCIDNTEETVNHRYYWHWCWQSTLLIRALDVLEIAVLTKKEPGNVRIERFLSLTNFSAFSSLKPVLNTRILTQINSRNHVCLNESELEEWGLPFKTLVIFMLWQRVCTWLLFELRLG